MTDSVNIKFWGVRGSTPCANVENMTFGGNTTCFQIELEKLDKMLIIDCGTGLRNLGNHITDHGKAIKGDIFITHPHWDHLQGFPFFKPFYDKDCSFQVYIPPQDGVGCKEILQGHMSNTFFPVTIDMLIADVKCKTFMPGKLEMKNYSVDYMWARHTVQTAIFRFRIGGKVIVIAPDNELPMDDSAESKQFISDFQEFVKGVDILVHDAQYNNQLLKQRAGWGHSSWERLIELTTGLGIKNLVLTHHDPDSDDAYLSELDAHVKKSFGEHFTMVGFAKEGESIPL